MIQKTKNRNLLLVIVFIATLATMSILMQGSAAAVSGSCWFGGGDCSATPNVGSDDVFTGRESGRNAVPSNVQDMDSFINWISGKLDDGKHNKTGAQFIISAAIGNHDRNNDFNDFRNRLKQDGVSFKRTNRQIEQSSFYDNTNGRNDVFKASWNPEGSPEVIVIRQGGQDKLVIEIACGNLANKIIPISPPDTPGTGPGSTWTIWGNTTVNRTSMLSNESAVFTHRLWNDGPEGNNVVIGGTIETNYRGEQGMNLPTGSGSTSLPIGLDSPAGGRNYCEKIRWDPIYSRWIPKWIETVVDVPAWDEWIPEKGHWKGSGDNRHWVVDKPAHWKHHPAITHNVTHPAHQQLYYGPGQGEWVCVDVVDPDQHITGNVDYEKGSNTDVYVTHTVTISPCPAISFTWYISGIQGDGQPYNDEPIAWAGGCSNSVIRKVNASWLNGQLGLVGTFKTKSPTKPTAISSNLSVYEVPYVTFKGHDIYATGSGVGNLPSPNINIPFGSIFFNTASGNRGSTDKYASIAKALMTNAITTAVDRVAPPVPSAAGGSGGLSAAWQAAVPSSAYDTITNNGSLPQNPTGLYSNLSANSGYYTATTPTISGSNIPNTTKKITVKSSGNMTIDNDIKLTSVPSTYDKDNSVILLISDGDINISPNVTRIDAILIAKGKINTCFGPARGNWEQPQPTGCRNPLTINGAMGASFINFGRSIGTRLIATSPTNPPAEEIKYPGYLNFATPYLRDTSASSSNAIFNAPPLL